MNSAFIRQYISEGCHFVKENAFFAVFFVYRIIRDFIPGDNIPTDSFFVPLLIFLAVFSLGLRSERPKLRKYACAAGICAAVLSAVLLFGLLPLLPGWDYDSYGYAGVFLAALACFRKKPFMIIRTEALFIALNLLVRVIPALAGLSESGVYTERGVIRSGLGTGHPNWLSSDLFYLLVLLYIGYTLHSRMAQLVLAVCVFWICDTITRTRTVSMLCLLFVALLFLEWSGQRKPAYRRVIPRLLRIADVLAVAAFPLMCTLCFLMVFLFPKGYGWVNKANSVLARRVELASILIRENGITPFGSLLQEAEAGGTEMQYAMMLVRLGIVGLTVIGIIWVLISIRCFRNQKRRLLYMLAIYAVYGATEGVMLSSAGNIFMFLALSDLADPVPEEERDFDRRKEFVRHVSMAIPAGMLVCLAPYLFDRMRCVTQLVPEYCQGTLPILRMLLSALVLFALARGVSAFIQSVMLDGHPSRGSLAVTGVCAVVLAAHVLYGGWIIEDGTAEVQGLVDADEKAIHAVLSSKTGAFYADPYPAVYRKRFPEIGRSVLYGKDLARGKNTTVLTDIELDGGNTFQTQGFQYVPVSDAHAVYTNDGAVVTALREAGFPVTPFFQRRLHVDLEKCAEDSYLIYEPSFPGIVIDQDSRVEEQRSQNIWTNYNTLYGGSYEVTFICRLVWPEENAPDENCILGVNFAHGGEIARYVLTPADADENGYVIRNIPFSVPSAKTGSVISFSVYGGNIRRLVVEDISFIRVG